MKTILTLTALLTASPALASDAQLLHSYQVIAIAHIKETHCGFKQSDENMKKMADYAFASGGKAEEMLPVVAGMIYAYTDMLTKYNGMGDFCRQTYKQGW